MLMAGLSAMCCAKAGAQSVGCFGMPSRVSQDLGYGYGAGHHAPMVRTWGQHPERVPRRVWAPAAEGPLYPAAYGPIGCYGEACPTAPAPHPALPAPHPALPAPEPVPVPAPTPPPAVLPEAMPAPAVSGRQAWQLFGR
jgi:hypothetical protein